MRACIVLPEQNGCVNQSQITSRIELALLSSSRSQSSIPGILKNTRRYCCGAALLSGCALVALPSMTVDHVPVCVSVSYLNVYEAGETTVIV
jgi:hypothetical protein